VTRGPVIHIVAAVVLDSRRRVLVVRKRGTSAFMQPGGKIEAGETPLDALVREVREELGTGLDVTTARSLGRFTAPAANEPGHFVDAHLFLVDLEGDPQPAAEIDAMTWFDQAAPGQLELAPLTSGAVLTLVRELDRLSP
jgi:8-oxo-dGTP diphosphatase